MERLQECLCQVVHKLGLCSADTTICTRKRIAGLCSKQAEVKRLLGLKLIGDGDGLIAELAEHVRGMGKEFPEEDLLAAREGFDEQAHQLLSISVQDEALLGLHLHRGV